MPFMPFGERGYHPKSPDQLSQQLESAQQLLGNEQESSLVPQSQNQEDVLKMSESELKQKFARRYEIYQKLLRDQKRVEHGQESNISPEEIEHMKKWMTALNSLDEYIKKHHEGEEITLRGKQIDVFQSLHNFLEEGGTEGYVKLPTGVGKTVLFTELIEAMDVKALIVVPRRLLVEQTGIKMEEFAPEIEVGKIHAYAKEHGRQVTIITYNSLLKQLENGALNPEDFDLLVLDEVHQSLSKQRRDVVSKFKDAIKIGFTATPNYSYEKTVANLLLKKEIHSMTIREAVEEGMLCSVSSLVVKTETDISKVKIDDKGDYDKKDLEQAINISARNKVAVDIYKQEFSGQLAVAYCIGVKHAEAVANEFNKQGVSAAVVSGSTPKKEQDRLLKQFHNGEIMVLCNADLLIEGFDEKQVSVCLNLRPTRSKVLAEQRGGRALRLDEKNEDKHATIIEFLDKGYEDSKPPVLFADIADGASFYPKKKRRGGGGGGGGRKSPLIMDLPGVDIIYEDEEIMKIVGKNREVEKKSKKEYYSTIEEASAAAIGLGIKSSTDYTARYHQDNHLVANPVKYYGDAFVKIGGWDGFLKREKIDVVESGDHYNAVGEASAAAIRLKIKSIKEYWQRYKEDPKLPSNPARVYKKEWESFGGWDAFFDKKVEIETPDYYATVEEASESASKLGIRFKHEYKYFYKKDPKLPPNPEKTYIKDWVRLGGWDGFLKINRVEMLINDLDKLKTAVQLERISSKEEYLQVRASKHPEWHSNPNLLAGWIDWYDFLGKNRKS